jgi:hypothetical protein
MPRNETIGCREEEEEEEGDEGEEEEGRAESNNRIERRIKSKSVGAKRCREELGAVGDWREESTEELEQKKRKSDLNCSKEGTSISSETSTAHQKKREEQWDRQTLVR